MMVNFNSAERDLEAWNLLFEKADPRLKIKNIVKPEGSALSFIEVGLE